MIEQIQFLKDLQATMKHENDHDNDGQASPRFWAIMDYKWVVTGEGHEGRVTLFDSESAEYVVLDEYVDGILNGERGDDFSDEEIEELKDKKEWNSNSEIFEWIEEYDDGSRFYPIYEEEVSFIAPDTMFLTKEEAKRHLEKNDYHYSSKAHTYAMTAWRAPKVEQLLKLLQTFDWDSIEVKEIEHAQKR